MMKDNLQQKFKEIRHRMEEICAPLETEDYVVQPIVEQADLQTEYQTVALVGNKNAGYTTLNKAGKHFITADEP